MGWDDGGRIQDMGCAQAFAPLREGGAARWKDCQWDWAFGANGKGGGGSTAGGRRCRRPLVSSAKFLIRSFPVRSRTCRDGPAQYSPRRGPCHFLLPNMYIPFMAAPPPSRRGAGPGTLLAPCIRGIRETVPLERFKIFCGFSEVFHPHGRAEARPSRALSTGRDALLRVRERKGGDTMDGGYTISEAALRSPKNLFSLLRERHGNARRQCLPPAGHAAAHPAPPPGIPFTGGQGLPALPQPR